MTPTISSRLTLHPARVRGLKSLYDGGPPIQQLLPTVGARIEIAKNGTRFHSKQLLLTEGAGIEIKPFGLTIWTIGLPQRRVRGLKYAPAHGYDPYRCCSLRRERGLKLSSRGHCGPPPSLLPTVGVRIEISCCGSTRWS